MILVFVSSLASGFRLFLAFDAGLLVGFSLAEVADDAVARALSLEAADRIVQTLVFTDSDSRHLLHLLLMQVILIIHVGADLSTETRPPTRQIFYPPKKRLKRGRKVAVSGRAKRPAPRSVTPFCPRAARRRGYGCAGAPQTGRHPRPCWTPDGNRPKVPARPPWRRAF